MAMVFNDKRPKGGQVPLLKHAVMQWLQAAERENGGTIRGTSYDIVADTRASVANVARALWDLQRQGLVTFRELKRKGTNGHASTTVLAHFVLTPSGSLWTADKAYLDDMPSISTLTRDDVNPAAREMVDAEDIASDIVADIPPAQALANLLRKAGQPVQILRANTLLGYARQSTAIYALKKGYPDIFTIVDGKVSFIGPKDWVAPTGIGHHSKRRAASPVVVEPTTVTENHAFPVAKYVPELAKPEFGPEITALLARADKRAKVAEAIAILENIEGVEEEILALMGRIPDDSPLEVEVLALLDAIAWLR